MMIDSIRATWDELKIPSEEQGLSASKVRNTNCYVFKTPKNELGFLMVGVSEPSNFPDLENVTYAYQPEKILDRDGKQIILNRCLELYLDSSCDAELLTMLFDRMRDYQPDGKYTTNLMLQVLRLTMSLVKRNKKKPSKKEVIGAWGELWILLGLIQSSSNSNQIIRRINGWESEGGDRDIIDFRIHDIGTGIAFEVKTSISARKHHIHGMNQITLPESFSEGYIVSILAKETSPSMGLSCKQLVSQITNSFTGDDSEIQKQKIAFEQKLESRGSECRDERFSFACDNTSLRFVDISEVPKPGLTPEITDVEWVADLEVSSHSKTHSAFKSSFFE